MQRILVGVLIAALASLSAKAGEQCVVCDEPAATYRCTVEQISDKYALGDGLALKLCTTVLQKQGQHTRCQLATLPEGVACEGAPRTVSLSDYQRAMGTETESTYEVGALEIARRNVHDTWVCVTSMFKDC